jgi:hypothetical protein
LNTRMTTTILDNKVTMKFVWWYAIQDTVNVLRVRPLL